MNFESWIEGINGLASLYSFDILPDGKFSEIRLMAVNKMNVGMLQMNPNAPEFYPGIPYRNYWMDLNFESFVYKCASTNQPLYSYVNARGVWLKGFYIPINPNVPAESAGAQVTAQMTESAVENGGEAGSARTVYCLYIISYSDQVETESMSQRDSKVANAVMEISIKLHESHDFYHAMSMTASEIKEFCGAEKCSLYIVDKNSRKCDFINQDGLQNEFIEGFASEMGRTPYEVAEAWERDLALSDCLLLEDLSVIQERDPEWYMSLVSHEIRNIILYVIRYNQTIVGYIWAANYDTEKMEHIKETLELSTFLLAAVITNHQLLSRLEVMSSVDILTNVGSRNAMDDRIDKYVSGEEKLPYIMGIAFADLNGLKAVNDDKGHEAGDKLLKRAAALLKIAFGDYEIYRAGGDEFVVFCPDITEENLERQVQQLRRLCDNTSDVSFAIGSAYFKGEYDINNAIQVADERMYKDKEEYYRNNPDKAKR